MPIIGQDNNNECRILCINCVHPYVDYETRYPPLVFSYLKSMAGKAFPDIRFNFRIINNSVEKELDTFKPDLCLLTSVSQNFNYARDYGTLAVAKNITTLLGGVHITALPSTLPKGAVAVIGEGENTFVDVLRAFLNDKLNEELPDIHGLAYWDGDTLRKTEPRENNQRP